MFHLSLINSKDSLSHMLISALKYSNWIDSFTRRVYVIAGIPYVVPDFL